MSCFVPYLSPLALLFHLFPYSLCTKKQLCFCSGQLFGEVCVCVSGGEGGGGGVEHIDKERKKKERRETKRKTEQGQAREHE